MTYKRSDLNLGIVLLWPGGPVGPLISVVVQFLELMYSSPLKWLLQTVPCSFSPLFLA